MREGEAVRLKGRLLLGAIALGLVGMGIMVQPKKLSWEALLPAIRKQFSEVSPLSTNELALWLADPTRVQPRLLDVRDQEEYLVSHLPGSTRVSGDDQPDQHYLGMTAETPIVVYCAVGYRSADFAAKLQKAGFKQVVNLEGSIFKWANEGRPLVKTENGQIIPATTVHSYDRRWGQLLEPARRSFPLD
jgi:rhodanese-related sulfurtransferase